ncbi:FUSC family protein [Acetobacter sp.]|uniref:FUSC family protein n=1 Tax=Acetobacter sp. TaxID=440 RepID=UPI0025BA1723|nr:FUSC family protein [Acetobacter sp.]MCH4090180.1 FUSC family protein [Acetobacter sp.]MCI1298874.1 FUSC family protein [Acetobacter sp.]MCI1314894.1 FUSC family protein [Acetobacter sp.]
MTAAAERNWSWLFAPSPANLGFAVRTSCAAVFSLLVAMWMELGSPQWAPLTVWVVATASRGESISKARWRLVGTIVGCSVGVALIASFPQQAALFFVGLAVWIGLCCGCATFFDGFRSYGFLVAGFTTAIVAVDVIPDPDAAFSVAMARGTYIILGIVCEGVATMMCLPDMEGNARRSLVGRLKTVTARTSTVLRSADFSRSVQHALLADIMAAATRIEYDVLEMGPAAGRAADHARAALASLLAAFARRRAEADWSTIQRSLANAEGHVGMIVSPRHGDRFRFRSRSVRQGVEGLRNGIRAAAGILGAWLLWEATGWPSGIIFVSYVALVYGLLATRETPTLASGGFVRGALWCALVAGVFVVMVMPGMTSPELLAGALMVPMVVGGLAARTPRLVNHAFSFNMFLPVLIGPANSGRYDEVSFLNGTSAFLAAVFFSAVMFRFVLIFRPDGHLRRTILWAQRRLRGLSYPDSRVSERSWLIMNADSMVRTIRTARNVPDDVVFARFSQHMAIMTVGMYVIEVRELMQDKTCSLPLARRLRVFLRLWREDQARAAAIVPVLLRFIDREPGDRTELRFALGEMVRLQVSIGQDRILSRQAGHVFFPRMFPKSP